MSNVFDCTMSGGGRIPQVGAMPNVGAMPKVDTVDVPCVAVLCRRSAVCRRVGNMPKSRQYTEVGHSMTTPMRQMFGLTMATPMGQCLVLP